MRSTKITCDICGKERGAYSTPYGGKYRAVYRFKRRNLFCFINGKDDIEKYDICDECLSKFSKFVKQENESYVEANKLCNSERS